MAALEKPLNDQSKAGEELQSIVDTVISPLFKHNAEWRDRLAEKSSYKSMDMLEDEMIGSHNTINHYHDQAEKEKEKPKPMPLPVKKLNGLAKLAIGAATGGLGGAALMWALGDSPLPTLPFTDTNTEYTVIPLPGGSK